MEHELGALLPAKDQSSNSVDWRFGGLILCVYGLLLGKAIWDRSFQRTVPLENVVWTASPDYKMFYGPGTPPSLALAKYFQMAKENGYLDENFAFPDKPIFINSALSFSADSREPFMVMPFDEQVGLELRRNYKK